MHLGGKASHVLNTSEELSGFEWGVIRRPGLQVDLPEDGPRLRSGCRGSGYVVKGRGRMRRLGWILLAALLATSGVWADDARDITVVNKSGKPIMELYISPSETDDWEEDVLGVDVLESGESVKIHFAGPVDTCLYDILATNAEGDEWLLPEVNLCETFTINITNKHIQAK